MRNKEKEIIKLISDKIRRKREELLISRSSLASEVGLDEKQLRRIENCESSISIFTLLKICYVLKLDIDFLKEYLEDDSILLWFSILRKSKGLSQLDLAGLMDNYAEQIGRIERGEQNVSICTLKKIADALNIEMKNLFDF